jgi:hypothetical protein
MSAQVSLSSQALRTPRAAATAGIAFSVLLCASLVLIRLAIPVSAQDAGIWITDPFRRTSFIVALNLVPFAGIAFLWFIGVIRDRMGQREDRFFASVFLGSGLLFVAMLFVSAALAGGLAVSVQSSSTQLSSDLWHYTRTVTLTLVTTYSMRMAAVFTISTATIALRLAIMPRWMGLLGYACAAVLLLVVGAIAWVELLFPLWVLLVSVHTLLASLRQPHAPSSPPLVQPPRVPLPADPP